jgi:mRNA-degrading endonuclease RelE of RelBE toxin-antitoxin system
MPYRIEHSAEARADIKGLDRLDQAALEDAIPHYLGDQPDQRSRRRKRMEPNPVGAPWALRLDELRVYYDIDSAARVVRVLRVGQKRRNRVFLRGVETDMREMDE